MTDTKDIQTRDLLVEITHPTTGEILAFKGKVVDVGLALKALSDQLWLHRDTVKHYLGLDAYQQFKTHPEGSMTRHYEGDLGVATVQIKKVPEFSPFEIDLLRTGLGRDLFERLFKKETTYTPRMTPIKKFLRTTTTNRSTEEAKRIIQEKMDLAEVNYIVKYEEKKAVREDWEMEESRAKGD